MTFGSIIRMSLEDVCYVYLEASKLLPPVRSVAKGASIEILVYTPDSVSLIEGFWPNLLLWLVQALDDVKFKGVWELDRGLRCYLVRRHDFL